MRATVHVAWTDVTGVDAAARPLNSTARLADRALPDAEVRRIVGARLLLARALATICGVDTRRVSLRQRCGRCGGEHGRPTVTVDGRRGPHVSIAHAGDVAAVAIARRPVGVDVEVGDARTWVRTEAVLKAVGTGLDVDPDDVVVRGPEATAGLVDWRGPGRVPRLRLHDVELGDGHIAAVAVSGRRRATVEVRALRLS